MLRLPREQRHCRGPDADGDRCRQIGLLAGAALLGRRPCFGLRVAGAACSSDPRRCLPCHDGSDKRTPFDLTARKVMTREGTLNQSYLSLLGGNVWGDGRGNGHGAFVWTSDRFSNGKVSEPYKFGSRRSKLVALLKAGHYAAKLDRDEWIRLVTWIDANAPYHDRLIDPRPSDGGKPRHNAEFRWPRPFTATAGELWQRVN